MIGLAIFVEFVESGQAPPFFVELCGRVLCQGHRVSSFAQGEGFRKLMADQRNAALANERDQGLIAPLNLAFLVCPDNGFLEGAESDFHFGQGVAKLVQLSRQR